MIIAITFVAILALGGLFIWAFSAGSFVGVVRRIIIAAIGAFVVVIAAGGTINEIAKGEPLKSEQVAAAKLTEAEKLEICSNVNQASQAMMDARQKGVQMKVMMTELNKLGMDANQLQMYQAMLIDAFSTPAYQSKEYRSKAVNDFANKYYSECLTTNRWN
jgi:ABC-type microcin C transport system permease subunit YejB